MPKLLKISLVRHGLVHNPDNIIYGRLPRFSLNKKGIIDARRAAAFLQKAPLRAVYSSPLMRTRQTAIEIIKYHPAVKLQISSLITEASTAFEGQPESELEKTSGDVYAKTAKRFEQPIDILRRSKKFIQWVRKRYQEGHVAAVTHGDVILFLLLWANRLEVTPKNKLHFTQLGVLDEYPATGSITTLTYAPDIPNELPVVTYKNIS